MLTVQAKCDHCGKEKGICPSSVPPEYPAIRNLLQKMGWIFTDTSHFCSYKCVEDYRLQCEHTQPIKKDGYTKCADCNEIWKTDYDSMNKE